MTILTTHVGSLPRSKELSDLLFTKEKKENFDKNLFDNVVRNSVFDVVQKQKEIGIDIVSDGEMSKISYATYIKDRYNGFDGDSPRNAPSDLKKFPNYLKKLAESGGTPSYSRPCCVSHITPKNNNELINDIKNLKDAMKKNNLSKGFMNSASPGVISLFLNNSFYKTRLEYLEAISDAMKTEFSLIVKSGLNLQLDCPDLALSRHMIFSNLSDKEFIKVAQENMEILNYSLRNINSNMLRMHVCWGNYEGPHIDDISISEIFEVIMSFRGNYILFESSNPRHAHEWKIFEHLKSKIPEEKILIPGVIDSTSNFIEHPELIHQRLEKFVNIVGKDRVIAGSDCGFGTFAGFGNVDNDIVFEKLRSMVYAAKKIKF